MNALANRLLRGAAALGPLMLTGCGRAPAFDVLGSFFPAWLVCFAVAILLAVIWVPYIVAHSKQVGSATALSYMADDEMPDWAARLKRAHYNLVENVPLFVIAVLAGEFANVHTGTTAACAMIFFWARVAHPVATMSHIWGTRTLTFTIGWIAVLVHLWVVLTA